MKRLLVAPLMILVDGRWGPDRWVQLAAATGRAEAVLRGAAARSAGAAAVR